MENLKSFLEDEESIQELNIEDFGSKVDELIEKGERNSKLK